MRYFLFLILAFFLSSQALAADTRPVQVTWTPPAQVAPPAEITGYRIYYQYAGAAEQSVDVDGYDSVIHLLPAMSYGDASFQMTSICPGCDIKESERSPPIAVNIGPVIYPNPPGNIKIRIKIVITQ